MVRWEAQSKKPIQVPSRSNRLAGVRGIGGGVAASRGSFIDWGRSEGWRKGEHEMCFCSWTIFFGLSHILYLLLFFLSRRSESSTLEFSFVFGDIPLS